MDIINLVLDTIQKVPLEHVIQILAAAGIIGLVVQKLKKWLSLQSNGTVNLVNGILSFTVVAVQYLTNAISQNPGVIPAKAAALAFTVIGVYHLPYVGIKALSQLAQDVKDTRASKARAAELHTPDTTPEVPLDTVVPQVAVAQAVAPATPDEFAA